MTPEEEAALAAARARFRRAQDEYESAMNALQLLLRGDGDDG